MSLEASLIVRRLVPRLLAFAAVIAASPALVHAQNPAARVTLTTLTPVSLSTAIDAGPIPSSQRLSLTLTLAASLANAAALDQYLAGLTTSSSPNYHKWISPQQFAANFTDPTQLAAATAWLQTQGLSVDSVSPAGNRIAVSGFASQIEPAFAVALHNYQIAGALFFANPTPPSLPSEAASLFNAIDGLDNLAPSAVSFRSLAGLVDANATPILTLDSALCSAAVSPSQIAEYSALFKQASAQGVTVIADRGCNAGAFPAALPEVTAVSIPGDTSETATPLAARPTWQAAPGLPSDTLRHAPDLTAATLAAFSQAISAIALKSSGRLGNINPTLYALAPIAGLYTQPDAPAPGTWEPATGLGMVDTAKLAQVFPAGTGTSVLSISSSAYAPTHGQSFTLTVTLASTTGGGAPTGTITFSAPEAGFSTNSVTLTGGMAFSPAYVIPGGTYNITAAYSGDANYAAQSGTVTVTVQPEAAIFTIAAPSTVSLGSNITATVTLASASGVDTPIATVLVTPSGISGAQAISQTVAGFGGTATAAYTFTAKQAGSVSLQASCTSLNTSFTCYTPQTSTTAVPQATPTVQLSINPTTLTAGTPVTLTAAVAGVSGIGPTGNVQFYDGATSLGFGSAPNASFTTTLAPGPNHVLTAVYQGDTNYLKATSNTVNATVGTAPTTTTVSASATTATWGQTVTLNITVAAPTTVNGTQPTGTLTFTGAGSTTTAPVSGGSAIVTLSNLAVGTWTIGTAYSGDANYGASTGNTVVVTVTQATASLNPNISSSSFTTGSTATLTVTVSLPGSATLPSGSTFIATIVNVAGASYTGTFTVNGGGNTGTGAVTIPAPPAGSYTLQITCGVNANFTCMTASLSITSTATGTVSTGTTPTTTVLAIVPTAPASGQAIAFTATVSAAASAVAANAITGSVSFYDGTTLLGMGNIATVGVNGVATASITLTSATTVTHSLTAVYSGDKVYASSTSAALSIMLTVAAANITLASNVTSIAAGNNVVFTATVSGITPSGASPTGTVSFYLAGSPATLIGTATLGTVSPGVSQAVLSTSNLPSGSLTIYATYNGDSNFGAATSGNIALGLSDYVLSFTPTTLTLQPGQSGSSTGFVALIDNFPGTVALSCTAPPTTLMTCSFNPSVLTAGGSTTLTVTTTAPKVAAVQGGPRTSLEAAGAVSLAALVCCLIPGRRRRLPTLLLFLLGLGLTLNLGCGGGNNFTNPATIAAAGSPAGTAILVIYTTGTNGATTVRHDYDFQVTIQ